MNPKTILKPVVLTTVEVGTVFGISHLLNKAATAVMPDLGMWQEGQTRKENAIHAAKIIGVSVAIALVAGTVASVAKLTTERFIWNDVEVIEPEN